MAIRGAKMQKYAERRQHVLTNVRSGPQTSTAVEKYVDPMEWDDERWDEFAESPQVVAHAKWLAENNTIF